MNNPRSEDHPIGISFTDPQVQLCPYAHYRKLQQTDRVYRDPGSALHEVLGYADLRKIALDPKTYSSVHSLYGDRSHSPVKDELDRIYREQGFPSLPTLINADEPVHRKYRNLVDQSFAAPRVKQLEPYIREISDMLIDRFSARGETEFVTDFAELLPLYVISDQIGVSREHARDLKRWSDAMIEVHMPGITPEREIELTHVVVEFQRFVADAYQRTQREPSVGLLTDLATSTIDGRPVELREVVHLISGILVAGNETTTSALASAMLRLTEQPELQRELAADAARIPLFIEEVLRLDAPLQCQFRRAVQSVELSNTAIEAESVLVLRFAAGNRDEQRYPNADKIDLSRPDIRQHLAFGAGIHVCLGQALARTELRIAYEQLLSRLADFRLFGTVERIPSFMTYGPRRLPIAFSQRPA